MLGRSTAYLKIVKRLNYVPERLETGTVAMKVKRYDRPKNLVTKRVAWDWASGDEIQSKHGLRMQWSLQPLRRIRQPLQLIFSSPKAKEEREKGNGSVRGVCLGDSYRGCGAHFGSG